MPYIGGERHSGDGRSTPYTVDPGTAFRRGQSAGAPPVPVESSAWHPVAQGWYRSLRMSGQSQWYEASDWATAWVAAEVLSRLYEFGFSATLLEQWNSMAARLMVAEGDRRRLRIELVRDEDTDDDEAESAEMLGALRAELEEAEDVAGAG